MNNFDVIINDHEILDLYKQISDFENLNEGWAHHDFNHVKNVALLVEKLLSDLNYDSNFIEEAKIAAILHDTGCLKGKDNHAFKGFKYATEYLSKNNINLQHLDLVLEAIKLHSDGFNTDNIIALTLILSDKLDIKYTRVAKAGYNIPGMRQLQFIKDISVNITDTVLKINFICDKKINKDELESFYFIPKVFKAINAFCAKLNLSPIVLFNNETWNKFSDFSVT